MQIGMIGLGKMGTSMVRRLLQNNHECVVYDIEPGNIQPLVTDGATRAQSLNDFAALLEKPRSVWIMLPAGDPTEKTILALSNILGEGDIVIDGGNTFYKDDVRRAGLLTEKGMHYIDVGTSGGVWGDKRGYCLMIGGKNKVVKHLEPVFRSLAPGTGGVPVTQGLDRNSDTAQHGYLHCGPAGAGHFVKMVHNGIEYGLMQAYAEGFDILRNAASDKVPAEHRYKFPLDHIGEVWRRGSVISSWLLDLIVIALTEDPELHKYTGHVQDSGEGRWTLMTAIERSVPADVLSAALYRRFKSRQEGSFADKLLSAMRHKFGGHLEKDS